jgi:hypothetical protein
VSRLRYSEFYDRINVDALEEAIDWSPEYTRGDNDVGFCVWPENHSHGDTTGKFAIHREERLYNCYVCGGGTLLSLVMELKDLDIEEATSWLYQFCEEDMRTDGEFVNEFLNDFRDVEKRVETLPHFNERVLAQFDWDRDLIPAGLAEWATSRAINVPTLRDAHVGYSDEVRRPAPKRGKFADDEDYIGPGVVFPHYWMGRLVGWQTRWLDEGRPEWVPKYTMTSDFPKESTLYGWDSFYNHFDEGDPTTFIVESVPSALFLRSAGYMSVATFGSSINDAQLRLLRRLQGGVTLAPDNDRAGEKWTRQIVDYLSDYIPVYVGPTIRGEGSDIGDLAEERDPYEAVDEYLEHRRIALIDDLTGTNW